MRTRHFFNTTGPCNPEDHYMLPPEERFSQQPGIAARAKGKKPARCYLVIFDRRPEKPAWKKRLKWITKDDVTVVGC